MAISIEWQKGILKEYFKNPANTGVLLLDLLRNGTISPELYAEMLWKEQKSYELFIKNMMKKWNPIQNELAQTELYNDDLVS